MVTLASTWLLLALTMSAFAWLAGKRWMALSLPLAVVLAALAIYIPTGSPRLTRPPAGDYTVLGADIQVDVAIFVLLKSGDMPATYYKFPYSTAAANELQGAQDAGQGQPGSVKMQVGQDGGESYSGPPPSAQELPPKQVEQPSVQLN